MAELLPAEAAVAAHICRIARDQLDRPGVAPDDRLETLGLDSLELTVLAVGLEDTFRVTLSEHDAFGVATVADLARLVASRAGAELEAEEPT